jgi:polar amino acid transport system substrate-binding protein
VEVQDEGTGISPEHLKHIMDPFFTTKRGSGGTGLGLSISYSIAKAHGGMLDVTSTLGKGTTAVVTLPVHRNASVTESER